MKKVVETINKPIKLWLDDLEEGAMLQAENLATLPFIFKHVALMPDAHQGYGMPIGGVLATKGVVVPNAVGVDIGCGMISVKTNLTSLDKDDRKKIMGLIRKTVPVGKGNNHKQDQEDWLNKDEIKRLKGWSIIEKEYKSSLRSLGTMGSGNHFCEIQQGNDDHIYIMIHSGSRNLGYKVATYYNKLAISLNQRWFSSVPDKHQLAFLPLDTKEGQDYVTDMQTCVRFAEANRSLMMKRVEEAFTEVLDNVEFYDAIDVAHNYARLENHFGQNVMVHRKGATSAKLGEIGIIPGSQGHHSYIVEGLGNEQSFDSCSHGAGRAMSRTEAIKTLDLEAEIKKLDSLGVIHSVRNKKDLDEAPGSYKDIATVMENQKDLVNIIVELTPLGTVKG
jgi:tRNA-splicing ligase RtcB (3'-phosphate/5'-hydroxy nucleic acid ligase)